MLLGYNQGTAASPRVQRSHVNPFDARVGRVGRVSRVIDSLV